MIFKLIFLAGILLELFLHIGTELLNLSYLKNKINQVEPIFAKIFTKEHLIKTYQYSRLNNITSITGELILTALYIYIIFSGNFIRLSVYLNNHFDSTIIAHLFLLGIFGLIFYILNLPINIFDTFYIEKKFQFSTITIKTFIMDNIKILLISLMCGVILLTVIFWFILKFPEFWWFYAWLISILFSLIMLKIFPTFIAPLFNKFTALEQGELRTKIMEIADKANFSLKNILKSDSSRRSKHSNAYFTGFGKNKQIVLFDTLINELEPVELASVLGHEIGHYKKHHIWIMFFIQTIISGFMFYIVMKLTYLNIFLDSFSLIDKPYLTKFIYSIIFLQSFLWILNLPITILSRKNEFDADEFSFKLVGTAEPLINSLIKMTKDNLSNPYPHPFYSWLYYSHPPLLERITNLQKLK